MNGKNAAEGRVEIYYRNSWATVCDDGWDNTDASVVCRQLGFNTTGIPVNSGGFGEGSGLILLAGTNCSRSQSHILNCPHNGFQNNDCLHDEDAGVRCGSSS